MKKSAYFLVLLFSFSLLTSSCSYKHFTTTQYENYAPMHKTIAVLPVEVFHSGRANLKIDEETLQKIEAIESIDFQISFYRQLIRQSAKRRHPVYINIQNPDETNEILKENEINIRDSWKTSPKKLANILGVDAVVKLEVEAYQYFTDNEAIALDIGSAILDMILFKEFSIGGNSETGDVFSNAVIVEAQDGAVIWTIDNTESSTYSKDPVDVMESINKYFARKFPYRR